MKSQNDKTKGNKGVEGTHGHDKPLVVTGFVEDGDVEQQLEAW